MTKKLFVSAITKFTAGVILLALLLFLPAGTSFLRRLLVRHDLASNVLRSVQSDRYFTLFNLEGTARK